MPDYTELGSFDLKLCRDELSQSAKNLVISKARGHDAMPSILYVRSADTLIHPLYNVYRNLVRTFIFPLKWEEAEVIPVFKKGSQTKVENNHAISLLNIGSKTFEMIIFQRLLDIYDPHMQERQYGFRTGRYLILRLLITLSEINSNIQNVECLTLFLFDFQKALDTIIYDIL